MSRNLTKAEQQARDFIADNYGKYNAQTNAYEWEGHEEELLGITEFHGWEDGDYSRSLLAIFKQSGKWFIVEDGHCSCYGYESWSPQEFDPKAWYGRLLEGKEYISSSFESGDEIRAALADIAGRE